MPADNAQPKEYRLSAPDIIDEDKAMMDKLMNYLEQHIGNPDLKMEDMGAAVNLGRTVFYGKMRSIVGMAPVEFMRHIRMFDGPKNLLSTARWDSHRLLMPSASPTRSISPSALRKW